MILCPLTTYLKKKLKIIVGLTPHEGFFQYIFWGWERLQGKFLAKNLLQIKITKKIYFSLFFFNFEVFQVIPSTLKSF